MTIFRSQLPDIDAPTDQTIWQWLYESSASPLSKFPEHCLGGFLDFPSKERINYKQVKEACINISTALVKKYDLKQGDTVSLFSRNTIWYPVMLHAVTRTGSIVSGASPAYGVEEMTYALKAASAKFLATSPTSMDVAKKAAAAAGIPKSRIFLLEGQLEGYTTIQDLIALGRSYGTSGQILPLKISSGKTTKDLCAYLSFSSGTTGLPKAVMISHYNVIAQCMQMERAYDPIYDKVLAVLPSFHITGLIQALHMPIVMNKEVVMLPGFTMEGMLNAVVEYQIGELLVVPPILIRLVRDPIVNKYDLHCVKTFISGAAPLSQEILQQLREKFPWTGFKQGYGMTETSSCVSANLPETSDYRYAHLVGKILSSTEVKIVKPDGSEGGVDEPGEILARGPQVVMGYLNRPDATAETFDRDGWLHTGDQGAVDAEGFLRITDRIKELVKVNGIGVAPAELEDLLLGHSDVEDVAVMGIEDSFTGEKPKAYVVLKPHIKASDQLGSSLLKYVQDNKVRHKWIAEVEFISTIPKSASGKILRKELREKEKSGQRGHIVRVNESFKSKL